MRRLSEENELLRQKDAILSSGITRELASAVSDASQNILLEEASVSTAIAPSLEKDIDNEDVLPGSIEPPALLRALTSVELAARLGVHDSTISRNKGFGNEPFREWSTKHDPDGITWEYRKGKSPRFHPIACAIAPSTEPD